MNTCTPIHNVLQIYSKVVYPSHFPLFSFFIFLHIYQLPLLPLGHTQLTIYTTTQAPHISSCPHHHIYVHQRHHAWTTTQVALHAVFTCACQQMHWLKHDHPNEDHLSYICSLCTECGTYIPAAGTEKVPTKVLLSPMLFLATTPIP